jgi:hypothetical protein
VTDAPLTDEQITTLHYFRRAAIRALAQCRFPQVDHRNGKDVSRPLWALAKVAVNDASVVPPADAAETAEAVIGLCNYQGFRGIEIPVVLDAIAMGLVNFVAPKGNESDVASIHWKIYSARIAAALDQFRKTAATNALVSRSAGRLGSLADTAGNDILGPLERGGGRQPDPEAINRWRAGGPVAALQPYTEVKALILNPAPRK